ncbi:MAG: hypothetical protein HUK26_06440 [Duodenibacillus sp.]|nr:hypothetical protein [Duodenibacillus sp.]
MTDRTDTAQKYPQYPQLAAPAGSLLAGAQSPEELKRLPLEQLPALAHEIRGFMVEAITDAEGIIAIDHLPHGTFLIEEVQAPAGYVIDEDAQPVAFRVDDQGFIGLDEEGAQFSDTLEVTLPNKPITLEVSKADLTGGFELAGAELVLKDEAGNVVDQWVSGADPHRISPIIPGKYTLTETVAPEGYLLSKETVEVEVFETGEIQTAVMFNDYTKVDISKTDIAIGKETPC